jgi:glutathione S-transferase
MLKIYGAAHSRAFRVIWLANELGLPYEHVPITFDVEDPECKQPWYLALNPNGRVPTIDDDGFILWETSAINLYLAEKTKSAFFPRTAQGKGIIFQWTFFMANDVEPLLITILRNRLILPPAQRNAHLAEQAEKALPTKFDIFERQLERTAFFGGEVWNMADFVIASVLYIAAVRLRLNMGRWPKMQHWLKISIERRAALAARRLREGS